MHLLAFLRPFYTPKWQISPPFHSSDTLLHEIFATGLFRDFDVRIFRDT